MDDDGKGTGLISLPGRGPRADEVYRYLRAAILRGELEPSERLVEQAIAERAQVSRTPVREALHRLEEDGLVRSGSRGVAVVELSDDELYELCVVREGMEGLAARLAAAARTELAIASLRHILDETRAAIDAGDVGRLVDLNHAFHETVWRAARNRYLANELALLRSLIERLQATTLSVPDRQVEALAEHERLVQALDDGDAAAAEAITRRHFQTAMAIRLSRRDPGGAP